MDMITSFRKYIDVFSTIKSTRTDVLMLHDMPTTFQECKEYLTMELNPHTGIFQEITCRKKNLIDMPTIGGLWLIHEPDTVYDACKGDLHLIGKPEFWRNIYEIKKDHPDFADRNERYLYSIRPKPSFEERMQALIEYSKKRHPEDQNDEPEYETPEWFDYQFQHTKEHQYNMHPDNIENWEGLIAPNGNFYSVDFGSHNIKAYYLLITHAEQFRKTPDYFRNSTTIRADNALDTLLEYGWCATRSVMYDQYVLPSNTNKPTKQQLNRIFDAIDKHNVYINTDELVSYFD